MKSDLPIAKLQKEEIKNRVVSRVLEHLNKNAESVVMAVLKEYCDYCGQLLKGHDRCKYCGILLHDEVVDNNDKNLFSCRCGKQHTLRSDKYPAWCSDCVEEGNHNKTKLKQ